MNSVDFKLKNDIVSRLSENFRIKDIILFGSYADGSNRDDSDIDIMVVLDEEGFAKNYMEKIDRRMKVSKPLSDLAKNFSIDLLVYTKDEWNHLLRTGASFVKRIDRDGVRLL